MTACPVCGTLPAQSGEPNCWCPTIDVDRPTRPTWAVMKAEWMRPQRGFSVRPGPDDGFTRHTCETAPQCLTLDDGTRIPLRACPVCGQTPPHGFEEDQL